jgi:hypothetical protein
MRERVCERTRQRGAEREIKCKVTRRGREEEVRGRGRKRKRKKEEEEEEVWCTACIW